MTDDDARLLERARAGDLEAFAEFVRRYEHRVRSVVRHLLDDERDVEEAAQDVFVNAWRNLRRFRRRSAVFTWLYRIAVNEALQRRRRRRLPTVELREGREPAVSSGAGTRELARILLAAVANLPIEYRAPLVLRDLEGLSNREVAEVLGISVAAAKSRVHRARMQVRAVLEAWEAEA